MGISAAGGIGMGVGTIAGIALAPKIWGGATSGEKPVMKPLLIGLGVGTASFAAARGFAELGMSGGRGVTAVGQGIGGTLGAVAAIGGVLAIGLVGASGVNGVRRMFD